MLHHMLRAAAGRDRIPTDGLVAWYTMDNISGSTLVDEQGSYNGTISGATQTTGIIGQALSFDGSNDDVVLSGSSSLYSSAFSHSFWFYSTRNTDGIITAGDARYDENLRSYDVYGNGSSLVIVLSNGSSYIANLSGTYPALSEWHHLVVLWDGTTGTNSLKVYLNDSLFVEGTPSSASVDASYNLRLGGGNFDNTFYYQGNIDQFRAYNRAIDSAEVSQLYNEGA